MEVPENTLPGRRGLRGRRSPAVAAKMAQRGAGSGILEARANYVMMLLRDAPWLDGKFGALTKRVQNRYRVSKKPAAAAVTRAYELLSIEYERQVPEIAKYLHRVLTHTIDKGLKEDLRVVSGAAAELRKLHGAGEPDRLRVDGNVTNTISAEDRELLNALKFTNAQRLAEIDKLERETSGVQSQQPVPTAPNTKKRVQSKIPHQRKDILDDAFDGYETVEDNDLVASTAGVTPNEVQVAEPPPDEVEPEDDDEVTFEDDDPDDGWDDDE